MFGVLVALVASGTLGAVIVDDETIRTLNTFFNFLTVAMLLWNQRKFKTETAPKIDKVLEQTEPRTRSTDETNGEA